MAHHRYHRQERPATMEDRFDEVEKHIAFIEAVIQDILIQLENLSPAPPAAVTDLKGVLNKG